MGFPMERRRSGRDAKLRAVLLVEHGEERLRAVVAAQRGRESGQPLRLVELRTEDGT